MGEATSNFDMDSIFSKIDDMSTKLQQQVNESAANAGKRNDNDFKNVEISFLGGVSGTYELKAFMDSEGTLFDHVSLHTVTVGSDKVTVTCTGTECPVCSRVKKLDELKNQAAWKFNKYKLNRLLVKIGDLPMGGVKGLKAGAVYLAYVDDKFFKTFIDSIKVNTKYFKDKLALMMDGKTNSAGFLVSATKAKKGINHNFQFIDQLKIAGISPKDVFGTESYKLANLGYFRPNYVDEAKQKKAISLLDSLILVTIKANDAKKSKPAAESKVDDTPLETSDVKTVTEETKVAETTPVTSGTSIPVTEVTEGFDPVNGVRDFKVINPDTDKPVCFGFFESNMELCTKTCGSKRPCMMEAMNNDRL